MQNYIEKKICRICSNTKLTEVLDLLEQPLANSYHSNLETQEEFPLKLNLCSNCFHLQLSCVVNPDIMFKKYLYVSGTSKMLDKYFSDFVEMCQKVSKIEKGKVLDIACNDGTQLDKFKQKDWDTYGVDPAENLYSRSSINHKVICDYWNTNTAEKIKEKFDIIVAQNVFAHVDNVEEFLQSCSSVLQEEGYIFIQTSQANMILNNEFDTIYHEHLSFFSSKSMKFLSNKNNFSLVDILITDIHGGSYVFVLKKGFHDEEKAKRRIELENKNGLYQLNTYVEYSKKCKEISKNFEDIVKQFSNNKFVVVGYGAAAKGNTFLNFSKTKLDYIIDDNPLKHNLYTPGMNIPIYSIEKIKNEQQNILLVPLAWNFFQEIKEKINSLVLKKDIKYLKYFPNIEIL